MRALELWLGGQDLPWSMGINTPKPASGMRSYIGGGGYDDRRSFVTNLNWEKLLAGSTPRGSLSKREGLIMRVAHLSALGDASRNRGGWRARVGPW
jgi:hypothetical protein